MVDNGALLYPSITFCTKYIWQTFPGVLEILNNNKSMDFYVSIYIDYIIIIIFLIKSDPLGFWPDQDPDPDSDPIFKPRPKIPFLYNIYLQGDQIKLQKL